MEKLNQILDTLHLYLSIILGYFLGQIGEVNKSLNLLVSFMVLDFITGFIKAFINRNVSSKALFKGGYMKCLVFVVIIIANKIDITFNGIYLRETVITYYMINEGISILENINEYIELPPQLKKFFNEMKEEGQNEKDN